MSGAYRTYFNSGAYRKYLNERRVTPTKYMVQLSATMEQTHETQLAQLYDVLGLRRVNDRYDVVSPLHETGPGFNILLTSKTIVDCRNTIVRNFRWSGTKKESDGCLCY